MEIGEDETDKLDEIFYIDQDLNKLWIRKPADKWIKQ